MVKRVFGSRWVLGLAFLGMIHVETKRDKQGRLTCIRLSISALGDKAKVAVEWDWE